MINRSHANKALELIGQAGELGITTDDLLLQIPVSKPTMNTILWRLRQEDKVDSLTALRFTLNIACGIDKTQARARLDEMVQAQKERQRLMSNEANRKMRERKREALGKKPISERQREQRLAASEKSRLVKLAKAEKKAEPKVKSRSTGARPPRVTKKMLKDATAAINRLAKRIKEESGKLEQKAEKTAQVQTVTWNVQVQKIPHQPGRYEVLTAESTFGRIGHYPEAANSCAARALG